MSYKKLPKPKKKKKSVHPKGLWFEGNFLSNKGALWSCGKTLASEAKGPGFESLSRPDSFSEFLRLGTLAHVEQHVHRRRTFKLKVPSLT